VPMGFPGASPPALPAWGTVRAGHKEEDA
jgi:hypothetical protein